MNDLIMIILGLACFATAFGLLALCTNLEPRAARPASPPAGAQPTSTLGGIKR